MVCRKLANFGPAIPSAGETLGRGIGVKVALRPGPLTRVRFSTSCSDVETMRPRNRHSSEVLTLSYGQVVCCPAEQTRAVCSKEPPNQ